MRTKRKRRKENTLLRLIHAMARRMLPVFVLFWFSILLMGPRVWDCYFGGVARVSSWHLKVLPSDHLPRKMLHTGNYIVVLA